MSTARPAADGGRQRQAVDRPPGGRRGEGPLAQETLSLVIDGAGPKGDVMTVAELAGVMGAKRTVRAHPAVPPHRAHRPRVEITPDRAEAAAHPGHGRDRGQTGVEMEALTAATVAALTVYDMVKGVERASRSASVRLLEKSGGKSGEWHRPPRDAPDGPRPPVPKGSRARPSRLTDRRVTSSPRTHRGRTDRPRRALVLTISDGVPRAPARTPVGALADAAGGAGLRRRRGGVPDEPTGIRAAVAAPQPATGWW